jgi:hypothetical protein
MMGLNSKSEHIVELQEIYQWVGHVGGGYMRMDMVAERAWESRAMRGL